MNSSIDKKIAIVGLGALFPDAKNVIEFWHNIIEKKVSIREMTEDLFESDVYYRPDLFSAANKQDKSITKIAAWIKDLEFDTVRKYKIPPSVTEHMDPNQHAALFVTEQALNNHSLENVSKDRVAVIFGNGMVGTRYGDGLSRIQFQLVEYHLRKHEYFKNLSIEEQNKIIEDVKAVALRGSVPITEDSAPGILPNIIAARISNVYDLHGPSFTVDAACASVLAAIITGIQGLYLGEYDAVICGGSDMPLKQLGFIYFSAINALSPDGSFPFDKRANGFVMGQGAGAVVLKRLADAVKDKDEIYAVITGFGEASDGKGKYIAAPNPDWQARTIENACKMAGYPVDTIEMIEAHGTATIVGDVVEVEGLKKAFERLGYSKKNYCGLTSVKSNIGHLKSAAGIAGLIKAVLALYHKQLPPTASFKEINPKLQLQESPFYILDELREWPESKEHPRRANVSSFGFGGADYHLALEEYREQDYSSTIYTYNSHQFAAHDSSSTMTESIGKINEQLLFFAAQSRTEVDSQISSFISKKKQRSDISFADFCYLHNSTIRSNANIRLAIIASSIEDLQYKYLLWKKGDENLLTTKGIYYQQGQPIKSSQTALLFPGQASQYVGMFRSIFEHYDVVRTMCQKADAYWFDKYDFTITSLLYPKNIPEEEASEQLRQTQNAHPVIFTVSLALHELLKNMGLSAQYMIGHSLGEITALAAAGKLTFENALRLIDLRGHAFSQAQLKDCGKMVSLQSSFIEATQLIEQSGIDVFIANINSPLQTVVAGSSPNIDMFVKFLNRKNIINKVLYVSHAFHTPLMKSVAEQFYGKISELKFHTSKIKVMNNDRGDYYPNVVKELKAIPHLLKDQIVHPVHFVRSIEKLYQDGVRLFVEVGPNSILSNLVRDILTDKSITVLTSNLKKTDDLSCLQKLAAGLFAQGIPIQPELIYIQQKSSSMEIKKKEKAEDQKRITFVHDNNGSPTVVYSGISIGLPGSYKNTFQDDNYEQIFAGRNFIERLTDEEKQKFVDLHITKLVKDEKGPSFKLLSNLDEVIQLAGKIGKIDLIRDFHFDEKDVKNMTSCIAHGIAAGYEALKDAHIPLVWEYIKTSTGTLLPQKLALPKEMQEETGVLFANGFPMIDPVIQEVSRYVSYYYGGKTRKELMAFYESIMERVKDSEIKKVLTDWYTLFYSRLMGDNPGEEQVYQFNYEFMMQISAQANNQLASLINAKGPNFQLNAACSSTSNAITIAEDFIRSGRVKRMIIVGADDPTSKTNFPLLGAGFLCTGAATNEGDLYKAAVPFDARRNGMIISAGAVGIVIETKEEVNKRGIFEVCELLGTHSFNTATHPSQIDSKQFSKELEKFIGRMERQYNLKRDDIARQALYISHETYTPPRGGCSQTEAEALQFVFGDRYRDFIVGNTKGMTGHTMGASLEDAVAAKSLQYGKCPPVVNYDKQDPMLGELNLSRGESHNRIYALKMSAGFGSQGHFVFLKKVCSGDARIKNNEKYQAWLKTISSNPQATTEYLGRILTIKDNVIDSQQKQATYVEGRPFQQDHLVNVKQEIRKEFDITAVSKDEFEKNSISTDIINILSIETQYPPEMLEPDMEFGADLGIDPEKQKSIAKKLGQTFLQNDELYITDETTISQLMGQILDKMENRNQSPSHASEKESILAPSSAKLTKELITLETLNVFSKVTKYPQDMLELDMEMEADLGIDTVKQATILSILGEKYHLEREEGMQLSNYPTIGHIVDLLYEKQHIGLGEVPVTKVIDDNSMEKKDSAAEQINLPDEPKLSRQTITLKEKELGDKDFSLTNKSVWILGDDSSVVRSYADAVQQKGAHIETFIFPQKVAHDFENSVTEFVETKNLDVIIDCTHIQTPYKFTKLDFAEAENVLKLCSSARFVFYQKLAKIKKYPAKILCLTAIDGYMGMNKRKESIVDPTFGALAGFYKSLRKEWGATHVRIIDFSPRIIQTDIKNCIKFTLAEIEYSSMAIEVAYPENKRKIVQIIDREIESREKLTFTSEDTFLITGGGTGIAARILDVLAQRYKSNFVIVDIIPIPVNIAELAALDESGLEKVKQDIHAQLKLSQVKVTPAMLNSEYEKITKAIETYKAIQTIKRHGNKIEYVSCDIRDKDKLDGELKKVRGKIGPITAIIHAAGIDKSRLLEKKRLEEFENVFSVKTVGAYNLMNLCEADPLKLIVTFSSISARFGNAAQLDYSAANEFLNLWAKMMEQQHKGAHVLSIMWSGWKDVGIAWRNQFVREYSEEKGVNFIDVEQGLAAFIQEIENKTSEQEIILHNGLDGFIERDFAQIHIPDFPFIDRILKKNGKIHCAFRVFSVKRDAFVDQHRLGKVPILPAVAFSELAVEYFALQEGIKNHYLLQDISFVNAFKLFREEPRELFVEGKSYEQETWDIEIKSSFRPPKSQKSQIVMHSRSLVSAQLPDFKDMNPASWTYAQEEPVNVPADESLMLIKDSGPQQRIILGPLYNDVIRELQFKEPVLIYPDGTIYPTYFPKEQLVNEKYPLDLLQTNPCFVDSLYQACAAHLLVTKKRIYLPWHVKELAIVNVPRAEGLYKSYAKLIGETEDIVTFNVVMVDGQNKICYYAKGAQFKLINL